MRCWMFDPICQTHAPHSHIRSLTYDQQDSSVILDAATRRNEITQNLGGQKNTLAEVGSQRNSDGKSDVKALVAPTNARHQNVKSSP